MNWKSNLKNHTVEIRSPVERSLILAPPAITFWHHDFCVRVNPTTPFAIFNPKSSKTMMTTIWNLVFFRAHHEPHG